LIVDVETYGHLSTSVNVRSSGDAGAFKTPVFERRVVSFNR
jgi:hypothetical protein